MNKFIGTGVALITPFTPSGAVDFTGLEKLINYLIDGGINYLVVLGTTGETATLTEDEKKQIFNFTAEKVDNRIPLVAGLGGNNTAQLTADLKAFNVNGYEAVLSVSPYYNKPTQSGIYHHYLAVADASNLPVILYNVPSRTGSMVSVETTLKLAEHQNIIATKEASGNFDQFNEIAAHKPDDFLLLSGDDPITLPMIALGASGLISVIGNAVPKQLSNMVNLCLNGDFKNARKPHYDLLAFTKLCFDEGNPAGIKAALKILGICNDDVRLPLVKASTSLTHKITDSLKTIL